MINMNIALTGANGSIGRELRPFLKHLGHNVFSISTSAPSDGKLSFTYEELIGKTIDVKIDIFLHLASINSNLKEDEITVKEFAKNMGVTYPMASDLDGTLFELFAGPKQGVTRNIVLDKNGEIIFLTRLYEREEFEEMIVVIDEELKK